MPEEIREPWGDWDPAAPAEAAGLFGACGVPWWIAGGYALELFAGRRLRAHADLDVLLLRRDQLAVQAVLGGWQWWAADPPGVLRPWRPGEILPPAVHDVWCRPGAASPWRIQIMLDDHDGDDWVSRRNPLLRRRIGEIGLLGTASVPYLAPEIQLFYKAAHPRPKDESDFAAVLPLLGDVRRRWLDDAIAATYGKAHPWRSAL
ncbi:nucleotidyltransferase domain-containing protein [Amycolatopsis samaneae]|uniref:Nucleotidyltransferase domain-containing protein n=1 Tax=Amycolatopsis samaneae TaxID=664691 RepID=A0ABW5GSH0_9PSEU